MAKIYNFDLTKSDYQRENIILRQGDYGQQVALKLKFEGQDVLSTGAGAEIKFQGETSEGTIVSTSEGFTVYDDSVNKTIYWTIPSIVAATAGRYRNAYITFKGQYFSPNPSVTTAPVSKLSTIYFNLEVLPSISLSSSAAADYVDTIATAESSVASAASSAASHINSSVASVDSKASSAANHVNSTVATVDSKAASAASHINSSVASVDTTASSAVSHINSDVTQADSALATLAQTLTIGGRNYLRNSSGDTLIGWGVDPSSVWSIATNTTRGNVFTVTPSVTWTGGGTNSIRQTVNEQTNGKKVTVSFWAKASVDGANFHSEPQGGANSFNTKLTTTWTRYSYTISRFSGIIYFMGVDAGTTYYLDDIKLEIGNIATDWTPAPEDVTIPMNLLYNTSFENGADGWVNRTASTPAQMQVITDGYENYLKVTVVTAWQGKEQYVPVSYSNTTGIVNVSADVYGFINENLPVYVYGADANKTMIGSATFVGSASYAKWTHISKDFVVPQNTKYIVFSIQSAVSNGIIGVKNPQITAGAGEKPFIRGSEMQAVPDDAQLVHKTGDTMTGDLTRGADPALGGTGTRLYSGGMKIGHASIPWFDFHANGSIPYSSHFLADTDGIQASNNGGPGAIISPVLADANHIVNIDTMSGGNPVLKSRINFSVIVHFRGSNPASGTLPPNFDNYGTLVHYGISASNATQIYYDTNNDFIAVRYMASGTWKAWRVVSDNKVVEKDIRSTHGGITLKVRRVGNQVNASLWGTSDIAFAFDARIADFNASDFNGFLPVEVTSNYFIGDAYGNTFTARLQNVGSSVIQLHQRSNTSGNAAYIAAGANWATDDDWPV